MVESRILGVVLAASVVAGCRSSSRSENHAPSVKAEKKAEKEKEKVIVDKEGHAASSTSTDGPSEESPGELVVYREPPKPREESPGACPGNKAEYHWIRGHWAWRDGQWTWVSGHWHKVPRNRTVWVAGSWRYERSHGQYTWSGGHWE